VPSAPTAEELAGADLDPSDLGPDLVSLDDLLAEEEAAESWSGSWAGEDHDERLN